jgi:hypothetical protein
MAGPTPLEIQLLPGEKIDFSRDDAATGGSPNDDAIDEKYVTGEVRIVTEQARYPLNTIASMVASGDYELNPEFQRRHRWSEAKQSRLIESFIMNVPVPPVFLYEDEFSHFEVMDGLQRMTAIAAFYNDELKLTDLREWRELNGRRYSELPPQVRRGVDRRYLSSIILLRETAKSAEEAERLKQLVFERINSGGEALKDQEARNAVYNGPLNRLCIELSRNVFLCRLWDIPEPTEEELRSGRVSPETSEDERFRTMFDVELVLRFFAHRQRRRVGSGAFGPYLDMYLKQGNAFPAETLKELRTLFERTVQLVWEVMGPSAFWLWRYRHGKWAWLERPTTSAYDAFMAVFSQNLHNADELRLRSDVLVARLPHFYEQHMSAFEARQTNMSNIRERDRLVAALVAEVLASPAL